MTNRNWLKIAESHLVQFSSLGLIGIFWPLLEIHGALAWLGMGVRVGEPLTILTVWKSNVCLNPQRHITLPLPSWTRSLMLHCLCIIAPCQCGWQHVPLAPRLADWTGDGATTIRLQCRGRTRHQAPDTRDTGGKIRHQSGHGAGDNTEARGTLSEYYIQLWGGTSGQEL